MTVEYSLRKLFEEQLRFRLRNGTEIEDVVRIGTAEFLPLEILTEFHIYEEVFASWLNDEWKPQQAELREGILNHPGNRNRYLDLNDAVNRQQVVPFVGSGMSVPSGLPTWSAFLFNVREFTSCNLSDLEELISSSSFEEAADLLASSTNPRLLAERVEHNLSVRDSAVISGPIALLPRLFSNLVVTTNLDNVLERLYELCEMSFGHILSGVRLADYRQLNGPKERFLLKLHGDCRKPEDRVLLSKEYEASYALGSTVHNELTLIYRQNNLLFLGCSLGRDRTVRLIEWVASEDRQMPKHYAFLAKPDNDANRIEREGFLTERGIYPIWYDLPHDEAIMALLDGLDN